MQLNAAGYFYDYRDKQETDAHVAFVGNISGLTNVPKSEVTGAELDLTWLPADGWEMRLGVAVMDSEIKEWMAVDTELSAWPTVVRRDASGVPLAMSPELQWNLMVSKEWDMGEAGSIDVAVDYSYSDETPFADPFTVGGEEYDFTNARIGYQPANADWRLLFWGRNITDEDYYPMAILGGNGPFVRMYAMPRTMGVTFEMKFGGEPRANLR